MTLQWESEVLDLLADQRTVKILATSNEQGAPHAVVKQSLTINEAGILSYLELLEWSQTNRNMVYSLWFDRIVAVTLIGAEGSSFQIKGKPRRAIVSGPEFEQQYLRLREKLADADLSAIWLIEPLEVINQSYGVRQAQEEQAHPHMKHLDQLLK